MLLGLISLTFSGDIYNSMIMVITIMIIIITVLSITTITTIFIFILITPESL